MADSILDIFEKLNSEGAGMAQSIKAEEKLVLSELHSKTLELLTFMIEKATTGAADTTEEIPLPLRASLAMLQQFLPMLGERISRVPAPAIQKMLGTARDKIEELLAIPTGQDADAAAEQVAAGPADPRADQPAPS